MVEGEEQLQIYVRIPERNPKRFFVEKNNLLPASGLEMQETIES